MNWEDCILNVGLTNLGNAWRHHDQDYIYNSKKLINLLDSLVQSL